MLTLGIETSCDDTSIAVLDGDRTVLANVVSSQVEHSAYGGVVPELASRAHVSNILPVFHRAVDESGVRAPDIDLIGVTHAPGLMGALLVGGAFAQGLSIALDRPLVPVHHLEAHIVANLLDHPALEPPAIALVVSGGHTLLVEVHAWKRYQILGRTRDDAAGEAFDKVAKLLGLGFPGGPRIERLALEGDPSSIAFPRPMIDHGGYDFSFSGLKTAVLQWVAERSEMEIRSRLPDVCASFQAAVVEVLVEKTARAAEDRGTPIVLVCGGVAANAALREAMRGRMGRRAEVLWPRPAYCTDNGAMIARTALMHADGGVRAGGFDVYASLPLAVG
ncbi:MAG TPA: tRNA (adenosine(37)-N6)-threonylcarbamoyltransferase complex transferase subunit TsaD [Gemmatimonadota bacterium]|nr:tRNA (adenosine(37)-N6)-threonylcarbamoyltransferase complex transferase subunit TsaD [Gemmatimonadota bacterium]